MSADFIDYHSLLIAQDAALAAQQSAFWTKIACFVSAFGVLVMLITAFVAYKALGQWYLQLHENNRVKFIDSLLAFNNVMVDVPKNILEEPGEQNIHRKKIISAAGEVLARHVIFSKRATNEQLSKNMGRFRELITEMLTGKNVKVEMSLITNTIIMDDLSS